MTCSEKIVELRQKIEALLMPLITRDCWLLEVPYYDNIGDTLIWQGERDFLRRLAWRCKGAYSLETFKFPKIDKHDLILFQGGGNFGDLWTRHHDFKMKVMERYRENEFLFFPQTVFFEKRENLIHCAEFLAKYNCTICARDRVSYELLRANFKNRILLVPDMAFCIDMKRWVKAYPAVCPLLLKRLDKEYKPTPEIERLQASGECDVSDWPTMMGRITWVERWKTRIQSRPRKLGWLYDPYMRQVHRPYLIREGVKLINSHTDIYTTRLHACILSILLGKENITFFDNSYGKNSGFYDTWLTDCENVKMVR